MEPRFAGGPLIRPPLQPLQLALGALPIATINTQLDGADYWHHQAVLGVWPRQAKVLLANPCEAQAEAESEGVWVASCRHSARSV